VSLGRLVVAAVKEQGRTKAEVARDYGVSRRWVYELIKRDEAGGGAGLELNRPGFDRDSQALIFSSAREA